MRPAAAGVHPRTGLLTHRPVVEARPAQPYVGIRRRVTMTTIGDIADRIPDVRWTIFEESSHLPHVEAKAACLAAVASFLDEADGAGSTNVKATEGIHQ